MKKIIAVAAASAAAVMVFAGSTAAFTINGGSAVEIRNGIGTATNDIIADLRTINPNTFKPRKTGYFGAHVTRTLNADEFFRYELFGFEADYKNRLGVDGKRVMDLADITSGNPVYEGGMLRGRMATAIDAPLAMYESTSLDFTLRAFDASAAPGERDKGAARNRPGGNLLPESKRPNFFSFLAPGGLWIFFDDGGAGPDDNHDDFVMRISVHQLPPPPPVVPLPAGVVLLGSALAGLGYAARRRGSR